MNVEKYIAEPGLEGLLPVELSGPALAQIEKHVLDDYPDEGCGFLYGVDGAVRLISEARAVVNNAIENRERKFEISPGDYLAAERYAVEKGLTLLGIYHSHPDHPAIPSIHDYRQAVPFFSYLIVSVSENRVQSLRSWQLHDGFFLEEKINFRLIKQY